MESEAQNSPGIQFRGTLLKKLLSVEAVCLSRGRFRRTDQNEIVRAALFKILPGVGKYNMDVLFFKRLSDVIRKVSCHQVQHDGVEFNIINSPWHVLRYFSDNPFNSTPQNQHVLWIRVLKCHQVAEVLGFGSFSFK